MCTCRKAAGDSTDIGTEEDLWGPSHDSETEESKSGCPTKPSMVRAQSHPGFFPTHFCHCPNTRKSCSCSTCTSPTPSHLSPPLFDGPVHPQEGSPTMPTHLEIGQIPATTSSHSTSCTSQTDSSKLQRSLSATVPSGTACAQINYM